ncbi:MAG: choice-of-anchor tandem repeat GloVer-containing protein [Limisphaerales bacterium]
MTLNHIRFLTLLFCSFFLALSSPGQTVEKVADLTFANHDGVGVGGYEPLDRFVQAGTNLWFTTAKGGTYDAGTISRFDLITREVIQVASLDNDTGKAPDASLLIIGNEGFFTTTSGGTGNRGTIAKIQLETGVISTLFSFPSDSSFGQTPRGALTFIGNDLWTTTAAGGQFSRGTLVKHSLSNGNTTVVLHFDGPNLGGQPYEGLTQVGNAWYFTTFTGGANSGAGFTSGAGTLGSLTFDQQGNPVVTRLLSLAGGYTQFPTQNPTLVGTNHLYFTTVGPNTNPGAIVRFNVDSGTATNVFLFNTNVLDPVLSGRQPGYNGLTEWQNELYFVTRQGGISNLGVVAKFSIASNTLEKLADLRGNGSDSLGSAALSYSTGTVVEENGRFYMYFPLARGGANTRGTIIRVVLPAPAVRTQIARNQHNELQLSWTGGYPPFSIEKTDQLGSGIWSTVSEGVTERSISIPTSTGQGFFRVIGSN